MTDNKQHPQQWKNLPDETPNLNQPIPQAPPFTDKNMDEVHEKESLRDAERLKDPNRSSAPGSTTDTSDNDLDEEATNDAGNLDIYNDDADDEPLDDASQSKQNDDNQRGSSGLVGTHDLGESVNPDEVLNKKL